MPSAKWQPFCLGLNVLMWNPGDMILGWMYIPGIMHIGHTLLCFVMVKYWVILPISFKVTALELGVVWSPQRQLINLDEHG